ncbi:MAG: hypothetical protein WCD35_17815 [Mycobacteriales bacterium]
MPLRLPTALLAVGAALALTAGCRSSTARTAAEPTVAAPAPTTAAPTPAVPTVPTQPPSPVRETTAPAATASAGETPADPLSPKPALESAPPPGQPTCRAAAVDVVDADAVVTKDAVQEVFVLRVTGPDCQLKGWPTVQLLGADGRPLAVQVRHGGFGLPAEQPRVTTLSRTTSASFVVATGRNGSCADAATVVLQLPGVPGTRKVATAMSVCAGAAGLSPVGRRADEEAQS